MGPWIEWMGASLTREVQDAAQTTLQYKAKRSKESSGDGYPPRYEPGLTSGVRQSPRGQLLERHVNAPKKLSCYTGEFDGRENAFQ